MSTLCLDQAIMNDFPTRRANLHSCLKCCQWDKHWAFRPIQTEKGRNNCTNRNLIYTRTPIRNQKSQLHSRMTSLPALALPTRHSSTRTWSRTQHWKSWQQSLSRKWHKLTTNWEYKTLIHFWRHLWPTSSMSWITSPTSCNAFQKHYNHTFWTSQKQTALSTRVCVCAW